MSGFEEWWGERGGTSQPDPVESAVKEGCRVAWNAALRHAAGICRRLQVDNLKPPFVSLTAHNLACDDCAQAIEEEANLLGAK